MKIGHDSVHIFC